MQAADWKGGNQTSPGLGKDLGLRTESPMSANISKASSIKSSNGKDIDNDSVEGVKSSGPAGDDNLDVNVDDLPQPNADAQEPDLAAVNAGLDTASATMPQRGLEV
jgi:protein-tyrosine phosphatase